MNCLSSSAAAYAGRTSLLEIKIPLGNDPERMKHFVDQWHSLSTTTSAPTRFRLTEQTQGPTLADGKTTVFCVTCAKFVSISTKSPWLRHDCIPVPILLSVEFKKGSKVAGPIHEIMTCVEQRARESPAFMSLWEVLTVHVVGMFTAACINMDVMADLRYLNLLHADCVELVGSLLRISVARTLAQTVGTVTNATFPERIVPHVYISFNREEAAVTALEAWYARVRCIAIRGPYGMPTLEATTLRLEEQAVDGEKGLSHYCTTCHRVIAQRFWVPEHRCRSIVSLTFKLHSGNKALANCFEVLSWVKNRTADSEAFYELWNVVTRHCVALLEFNFLARSDMERLFTAEVLNEEALEPEMLLALRVHAAEELYST